MRRRAWRRGGGVWQGQLEMWVEMYDLNALKGRIPKMPKLVKEEDMDVELRIVIWEASEMEEKDTITQANDLYIVVVLQGIDEKGNEFTQKTKTDVHYRAQNGKGSFNFRIIFRFPVNKLRLPRLKFQVRATRTTPAEPPHPTS